MLDCKRIYADYSDKIQAYLKKHVSDADIVSDLHSKVFQKIVEHADSYRGNPDAVSSFVYTITKSCVIDYYRTRKTFEEIDFSLVEDGGVTAEGDFFSQHTLESLAHALEMLSAEERQIIEICYWQQKALKTAAFITGLSYGAVKLRHRSALEKLRNFMQTVC
ncbi:MAG: sigma-70 family RNA polymerase sigma factor [Treponema sp.]|nr:sigma-70 family RNA polymerase sigma factor [Treponema sp.]